MSHEKFCQFHHTNENEPEHFVNKQSINKKNIIKSKANYKNLFIYKINNRENKEKNRLDDNSCN